MGMTRIQITEFPAFYMAMTARGVDPVPLAEAQGANLVVEEFPREGFMTITFHYLDFEHDADLVQFKLRWQ